MLEEEWDTQSLEAWGARWQNNRDTELVIINFYKPIYNGKNWMSYPRRCGVHSFIYYYYFFIVVKFNLFRPNQPKLVSLDCVSNWTKPPQNIRSKIWVCSVKIFGFKFIVPRHADAPNFDQILCKCFFFSIIVQFFSTF